MNGLARNRRPTTFGWFLALLGVAFTLIVFSPERAAAREASIVIDANTGRVLHAVNADTLNYPASLTKMMTLYLLFEALEDGRLTTATPLKVSNRAAGQAPTRLGLAPGTTIMVKDAILALITKSANDVAVVVAEGLAGSEHKFAEQMTEKARALGMTRTHFRNASGLPNRRQLSTVRDMAVLARALARDFPREYRYFATRSFSYSGQTYTNHNKLLASYSGTDGVKTGYTHASGYNLAAAVERDGTRLIAVVFGGKTSASRDRQITSLLDDGFAKMAVAHATEARAVASRAKAGWGVQVGAYSRYAPAHLAVTRAARWVPDLLLQAKVAVTPVTTEEGTIYRARLVGLSETRARDACKRLAEKRVSCIALSPRDLSTASDAS